MGSRLFSLYKPLASLASSIIFSLCNRSVIVVNERARSASGFVLVNVRLSVALSNMFQCVTKTHNVLTYDVI